MRTLGRRAQTPMQIVLVEPGDLHQLVGVCDRQAAALKLIAPLKRNSFNTRLR